MLFFCQETCFNNAIQCVKDKKNLAMKAGCLKELFVCIKDKGPEEVVFDAIEDMGQMENSNGFRVSSCPRFGNTSVVTNSCRGYL